MALTWGGLAEIGRGGFALGVGGARSVIRLEVSNLALGRLHGAFSAMATSESFAREGADGLLGMSVLGAFDVDLDVPGQQLRLYSATGNCGKPAVALDEPIYAAHLQEGFHTQVRPLLPVVINGQRFTALLDTGSPRTFLFAGTAARLGLGAAAGPATALKIEGVGGRSTAHAATARHAGGRADHAAARDRRGGRRRRFGGRSAARPQLHARGACVAVELLAQPGDAVSAGRFPCHAGRLAAGRRIAGPLRRA